MKKLDTKNNKFITFLYILIVLCIVITYEKIIGNATPIFQKLAYIKKIIISVLSPFIYGFFIAFLLNSLLKFIEDVVMVKLKIFQSEDKKQARRAVSASITLLITVGFIVFCISFLIPSITENFQPIIDLISQSLPRYLEIAEEYLDSVSSGEIDINDIFNTFNNFFKTDLSINDIFKSLTAIPNIFNAILKFSINFVMGLVIAFYVLFDKEKLFRRSKDITRAFFNKDNSDKIFAFAREVNNIFEKYFVGNALDAVIIGVLFFIGGLVMKLPFLPVITLIIAITNLIPYFGPFMGAIPAVALVLLNDLVTGNGFSKAIILSFFILVLQQADGIIIKPKVIGDQTGLSPIEVMFSIIVGGAIANVLGMFLGVPIFALIKNLFNSYIDKRLERKNISRSN